MPDLSIIICNYNVESFLEQAIRSIKESLTAISAEIIVVDNDSTDGSVEMVRRLFPEVILLENEENAGFARANNQAMQLASGDFYCLINPDTLIGADTLSVCLDYLRDNPDVGVVGCKILNPDGSLQKACRRSIPTPWSAFSRVIGLSGLFPRSRLFGSYHLTYLDENSTAEVGAISGSFMMVRKKAVDEAGLLDENFFMYGEDLDWCYRIHNKGWKIVYLPATSIIHYKGMSARKAPFDQQKLFYQAMRIFVQKHLSQGRFFLSQWLLLTGIWMRRIFSSLVYFLRIASSYLIDLALLQVSLLVSLWLRFGHLGYLASYRLVDVVYSLIWISVFAGVGLYGRNRHSYVRALFGVLVGLIINASLTFFFKQYAFSRQVVLTSGFFNAVLVASRRVIFSGRKSLLKKKRSGRRTLMVGWEKSTEHFLSWIRHYNNDFKIIGIIAWDREVLKNAADEPFSMMGTLKDIERLIQAHDIDEIIFPFEKGGKKAILTAIHSRKKKNIQYYWSLPGEVEFPGPEPLDFISNAPLSALDLKIYHDLYSFLKRMMDLVGGLVLLPAWMAVFVHLYLVKRLPLKQRIVSDGYGSSFRIRVPDWRGTHYSEFVKMILLVPYLLRGRISLVGTALKDFSKSQQAEGYKPGMVTLFKSPQMSSLSDREKERYLFYYLKSYSPYWDIKLLCNCCFKTVR